MRCGDCIHWIRTFTTDKIGGCGRIKEEEGELPDGELAGTWDSEGYHSGLTTAADFGCVLFVGGDPIHTPIIPRELPTGGES